MVSCRELNCWVCARMARPLVKVILMTNSRSVLLAIAAVSFGLIGVALYLQHAMNMLPCPLCVIQRYLFIAIGIGCLIGSCRSLGL